MVLLDVSFNDFLRIHNFDHFELILFKRLSCKILFSDFVYLLLDRITCTNAGNFVQNVTHFISPYYFSNIYVWVILKKKSKMLLLM